MPQMSPFNWLSVLLLVFSLFIFLNILVWNSFIVYLSKNSLVEIKTKEDVFYFVM